MSTLYVVRRERCGCLFSTRPAKDQSAPVGREHPHSDGSVSVTMSVESAAVVPELCRACKVAGLKRGRKQAPPLAEDFQNSVDESHGDM